MAAEIIAAGKNESAAVQKSGLAESFGFAWAQVRQPPSDGLHSCPRLGRPAVPAPPVVDQCNSARTALAALDVLGREAAPPPLILQLVKPVLAVSTVTIELTKGVQRVGAVCHQHRILPSLHILVWHQQLDLLTWLIVGLATQCQIRFDGSTQNNDPTRFVPAREFEGVFDRAPTLVAGAGRTPVVTRELACQQLLNPYCLAQLEQVGLGAILQLSDERLVAKATVSSDQGRALLGREFVQHADQSRSCFGRAVLFAG